MNLFINSWINELVNEVPCSSLSFVSLHQYVDVLMYPKYICEYHLYNMHVCMYIYIYICIYIHIYIYMYIHTYIYVCMYVCMYVYTIYVLYTCDLYTI